VKPQLPKELEDPAMSLSMAVESIDIAEKNSSITPAKAAFSSVSAVLTIIKVCSFRVHAGLLFANVYRTP
jgi:hypothetical protein